MFPHACHNRTIRSVWKRLQSIAEIEGLYRFHDLRVSFCTNLVASGVEAPQLKELARHRSIATTLIVLPWEDRGGRPSSLGSDGGGVRRFGERSQGEGGSGEQFGERVLHFG